MRAKDLSVVFRDLEMAFGVFSLNTLLKQLKAPTKLFNPVGYLVIDTTASESPIPGPLEIISSAF